MLVIGSAAGVAFMGMEKVDFLWYLRKVLYQSYCRKILCHPFVSLLRCCLIKLKIGTES